MKIKQANLIIKIVLGITFAVSIYFNFKLVFNKQIVNNQSPTISTKGIFNGNEFSHDGRTYTNTTINNYTINSNGELKVTLSATDAATGDSVTFASQSSVEPAKWGTAVWGESKWE